MGIRIRKLVEEPGEVMDQEGYEGVNSVWIAQKKEKLEAFSSRLMRIKPGGYTALHAHDREHLAIVIMGRCIVETTSKTDLLEEGSIISVKQNVPHRFRNPSKGRLVLLIMNFYVGTTVLDIAHEEKL